MDNMEEKLGAILSNPQMMETIMNLAQSLGQNSPSGEQMPQKPSTPPKPTSSPAEGIDPAMISKFASMAGQSSVDTNQRALLQALTPYVSQDRVAKLENAMRAAKLAKLASGFLQGGGIQLLTGGNRHV